MKQLLLYKQGNQSLGSSLVRCTGNFNLCRGWARSSVVERMFSVQRALNSVLSIRGKYLFCVLEWILSPPCPGGGTSIAGEKSNKKTFTCQLYTQTPSLQQTLLSDQGGLEGNRHPAHLSSFPGAEDLGCAGHGAELTAKSLLTSSKVGCLKRSWPKKTECG